MKPLGSTRVRALDIFRGLTVALMILVNNPGTWEHIYAPFEHAPWHGYTLTDLVFPFFLFAVGNAIAFVSLTPEKILKRTLWIFGIGFLLNWSPFLVRIHHDAGDEIILKTWTWIDGNGKLVGVRVMGVLQRIAIAYGFAAAIIYRWPRQVLIWAFAILVLSCGLALGFGIFGHAPDPWSMEGYFGTPIDRIIFGSEHLYQGEGVPFDPEGLMSSIATVAQVLIGYWVGRSIKDRPEHRKTVVMSGIALLAAGYLWSAFQPINKKIWTSSYTLVTSGWAIFALLAVMALGRRRPDCQNRYAPFFEAFGRNPLFIFVLSGFFPRVCRLFGPADPIAWFYREACARVPGPPENGSLVYAVCMVLFYYAIARLMDKHKIYVRV
ncbi:MAG: DUF1624 domain-containing protein [Bdellovibrionales bacterium]|nr:DUF1624 domain-containing protein [Bdellovibrionales bacterium]